MHIGATFRVFKAALVAYLVASYTSEVVFWFVLSTPYVQDGPNPWLIAFAPISVAIRYLVLALGTLFGGPESFGQQEVRLPFAVFLFVFGSIYVLIRYVQDRRRKADVAR